MPPYPFIITIKTNFAPFKNNNNYASFNPRKFALVALVAHKKCGALTLKYGPKINLRITR